jgi:hypothetical protein
MHMRKDGAIVEGLGKAPVCVSLRRRRFRVRKCTCVANIFKRSSILLFEGWGAHVVGIARRVSYFLRDPGRSMGDFTVVYRTF